MNRTDWAGFVVAFVLCFIVAGIGGWITAPEIPLWYQGLRTSPLNPPNYLFGPVWSVLYAMMALAAGIIWRQRSHHAVVVPLVLFAVQLGLNLAWTILFFGLHHVPLASLEIIILDLSIAATLVLFWSQSRSAGLLMLPYLAWSLFASYLCWQVWALNPPSAFG